MGALSPDMMTLEKEVSESCKRHVLLVMKVVVADMIVRRSACAQVERQRVYGVQT